MKDSCDCLGIYSCPMSWKHIEGNGKACLGRKRQGRLMNNRTNKLGYKATTEELSKQRTFDGGKKYPRSY